VFRRILIGLKRAEGGRDAIALGRLLAEASGASMVVATVSARAGRAEAEELAGYVRTQMGGLGAEARWVRASSPAAGLGDLARSWGADLIVLGPSHRAAAGGSFFGGTAERLLHRAGCAVAVAPRGLQPADSGERQPLDEESVDRGLRLIGVGFDGSLGAEEALRAASELAVRNQAALRVFTVAPPGPGGESAEFGNPAWNPGVELRETLHRAVSELPAETRAEPILLRGSSVAQLAEEAQKGIDLLVMGSHAFGPLGRTLYGSVVSELLPRAPCPLLIFPRPLSSAAEEPAVRE